MRWMIAILAAGLLASCGNPPTKRTPGNNGNNGGTNNGTNATNNVNNGATNNANNGTNNGTNNANNGTNNANNGVCGDGTIDPGETCDGNCPTTCDDSNSCTEDVMAGSVDTCDIACSNNPITTCAAGDGCCPADCDNSSDGDCSATCGNGTVDQGETCDGDCPQSCNDNDTCTEDVMTGSAANCNVQCSNTDITQCIDADGCCPSGCTFQTDNDCQCSPRQCTSSDCGVLPDGCGGTVDCGGCGIDEACQSNQCVDTQGVGTACTQNGDCTSGGCAPQRLTGFPGGYCTASCMSDSDCPNGTQCGEDDWCHLSCTSNADCVRNSYECYDFDSDGDEECAPVGNGNNSPGESCSHTAQCTGGQDGRCLTEGANFNNGYCTELCASNSDCPSGSHCLAGQICVETCSSTNQCRGSGYECLQIDNSGSSECFRSGTGAKGIGASCDGVWECSEGQEAWCFQEHAGWPSGYCSQFCQTTSECPAGSECWIPDPNQAGVCVDTCASVNECRNSYRCATLGQNTTEDSCVPN